MSTWLYDEHGVPRMRLIYDGRILDIEDNLVGWVVISDGAVYTNSCVAHRLVQKWTIKRQRRLGSCVYRRRFRPRHARASRPDDFS